MFDYFESTSPTGYLYSHPPYCYLSTHPDPVLSNLRLSYHVSIAVLVIPSCTARNRRPRLGSTARIVDLLNSTTPRPCLSGSSSVHRPRTPVAGDWKKTLETGSPLSVAALAGWLFCPAKSTAACVGSRGPYSMGKFPASQGRKRRPQTSRSRR